MSVFPPERSPSGQSHVKLRKQNSSVRNNLRSLLYSVAEDLSRTDLDKLLFLTTDVIQSKREKERIKSSGSPLDLFEVLLERDALNDENINALFDLLTKIRRFDVMKKAKIRWVQLRGHSQLHQVSLHTSGRTPAPPVQRHPHDKGLRPFYDITTQSPKPVRDRGSAQRRRDVLRCPPGQDIDWDSDEVQELLSEPFRPRAIPITRNHRAPGRQNFGYSQKSLREYLTQSIATGSYYY